MFKNLRIGQKLTLIGVAFMVPIAVLMFLLIKGLNKDIDFNRWEKYGNEYQRPLEVLLQKIAQHKLLSERALAGGQRLDSELSRESAGIDGGFVALKEVDRKLSDELQTTAAGLAGKNREHFSAASIEKEWRSLESETGKLTAAQITERHAHLIADVRALISHVGDTSNLILDPDLDTYYMMDVTLLALPQTQDRLQEIISYASGIARRGIMTPAERMQLNTYAALLKQSDIDRINADAAVVFIEDANFLGMSPTLERNWRPVLLEYTETTGKLIEALSAMVASETVRLSPEDLHATGERALGASFKLWDVSVGELDVMLQTRVDDYEKQRSNALLFSVLSLAVWAIPIFFVMTSITRPLSEAVTVLSSSAAELTAHAQSQAAGATEQAAAVAEVTATVEELSRTAQQIAETAHQVSRNAENNLRSADTAHLAVDEAAGGMETLRGKVHTLAERILALGDKAQQIGRVVSIINDFAGDTHLLALNASIEAAGAGEHGKRFAVVASEVKRLAERVVQATAEIRSLVEEVQAATNSAVMSAEDGAREAERGSKLAARSGEAIAEILEQVQTTVGLAQEISLATQQQGQASEQVARTMHDVSVVAQQAASTSQQSAASAEQLTNTAHTLASLVGTRG